MIKSETTEIKGRKYIVTLFPAMQAYLMSRELIGIFTSKDPVGKLCEMDKDGELILKLFSSTSRDELAINKATFDNIFTGNLPEMVEALKFVFEVNFKDFFQGSVIGELAERAKAAAAQMPQEN